MKVSKATARQLRVIAQQIVDAPKKFDMSLWASNECGTTCCIGGHAIVNAGICTGPALAKWDGDIPEHRIARRSSLRRKLADSVSFYDDTIDAEAVAREVLGLNTRQAMALFHVCNWPDQFKEAYGYNPATGVGGSRNPTVRAHVAAARIEHFIETGE